MSRVGPEAARTLDLFAEKFGKLRRSTVWKAVETNSIRFSLKAQRGEPVELDVEGPSEEAVDAFVLTLRFFLQNNERISIGNMARLIQELPIDQEVKDRVAAGRKRINAFLDQPCGIKVDGDHPSNREVLYTFLYGGLAHANPDKRPLFLKWASQGIVFGVMQQIFYRCLVEILKYLAFLDANLREAFAPSDATHEGTNR